MNPGSVQDDKDTRHDDDFAQWEKEYNPSADSHNIAQQQADKEFNALTSPEHLKKEATPGELSGGEKTGLFNPDGDSKAVSPEEIAASEKAITTDTVRGGATKTSGLFTNSEAAVAQTFIARFKFTKKKGAVGGVIGIIIFGIFFTLSLSSGPGQVVQLGEILQRSFSKNNSDSSHISNRLFRYFRAANKGDIGETRVGILGSKVFASTLSDLSDIGVEITRGPSGAPLEVKIDTNKLKTAYPELEGASDADAKSFISNRLSGVSTDQITGEGGKFTIDQSHFNLGTARLTAKSTVGLLDDGKVVTAIKARFFTRVLNLPSLLHPWKRILADQENKNLNGTQALQQEEQTEAERKAKLTDPAKATGDGAVADVEGKSSGVEAGAVKALTFTAGACYARSIAGDIVAIDHARVVLPAVIEALDIIAAASQIQSGKDLTSSQVSGLVHSFTDSSGKTIWQSQALQSLSGGSTAGLADISPDSKQAFTSHNTANAIRNYANDSIGGGTSAALLCSGPGQLIQGVTTVVISAVGELGSDGTLTPAIVAAFAAKTTVSFAGTAVFMHFLQQFILNKTTAAALAKDAFKGPEGGNLLAYGSRAAANLASIASGGISLGNKASTLLAAQEQQQAKQQFESESMFARMFNVNDSRSLTGHLADSISPNWSQNVSSLLGGFMHISSTLPHLFGSLLPTAAADPPQDSYDWSFPQAGLPDSVLNDPDLQDPYANDDTVAKALDGSCENSDGSADSSCGMIDRAQKCFGVTITHDANIWDVMPPTNVIDPNADDYVNANCDPFGDSKTDDADKPWARMMMFVASTVDMKAIACHQNDSQSCADFGIGGGSSSSSSAPSTTPTGDSQALAKQVQANPKIKLINGSDADIKAAAAGQLVTPGPLHVQQGPNDLAPCAARTPVVLSPLLLQLMLNIAQKYTYSIGAITSNHDCDTGRHPLGTAIDIDAVNGTVITGNGDTSYTGDTQLFHDFATYVMSVEPQGNFNSAGRPVNMGGQGQKQCQVPAITAPKTINYFNDLCNHLHVDVGVAQ